MEEIIEQKRGWKPIPLPLKILLVVLVLWAIGSVLNLPNLSKNGLPLAGVFVYGTNAMFVVLLLDIIGPITFLFALWNRRSWAPVWAFSYIGLFILNSLVALFTVRDELGTPQILGPLAVSSIFVVVIYWQRSYFKPGASVP